MTRTVAVIVLAMNLASLWQRTTRETNSHAANARGVNEYQQKKYVHSAESFRSANAIASTPESAFNLGTAEIAAGNREEGSAILSRAMPDRRLRADALYNRGTSALASKAYDYAIRDYIETLRLRPGDGQAKRNLEIALARKQELERSRSGRRPNREGRQPNRQRLPQASGPSEQQSWEPQSNANVDALLRSVQQQEREELQRMKRARGEMKRVGW